MSTRLHTAPEDVHPADAEFSAMRRAHDAGDFGRARMHRQRLFRLGWSAMPTSRKPADDDGPRPLFGRRRERAS